MGRTPNALEQSPHDPTCGITRAGNNVDYHEIILGNGTSTCQPLDTKTCVSKVARIEPQAKSGEEIPDSTAFHPGYTRDKTGTHISIDKRPITPQLGNVDYREIILGNGTCRPPEDATAPKPGPQDPAEPVVTRPAPVEGPVTQPALMLKSKRTIKPEDK